MKNTKTNWAISLRLFKLIALVAVKGILALGITVMPGIALAACGELLPNQGQQGNEGNKGNEGKGPGEVSPGNEPTYESVKDIEFNFRLVKGQTTQAQVNAETIRFYTELVKQSQTIANNYMKWLASLSPEDLSYNAKSNFVYHVLAVQRYVQEITNLSKLDGLSGLFTNTIKPMLPYNEGDLFNSRHNTLRLGSFVAQREHFAGGYNSYQEMFDDSCAWLRLTGGENIITPQQAINILPASISAQMPDLCGPVALKRALIQQYIDLEQFSGWIYDLKVLELSVPPPAVN
jgi:hypothetical protein